MKAGDEVTIKNEALVGQDFQFFDWKEGDIIFKIEEIIGTDNRCKLVADGYGNLKEPDMYGNGAVYVNVNDLINIRKFNMISEVEYPENITINDVEYKVESITLVNKTTNERFEFFNKKKKNYKEINDNGKISEVFYPHGIYRRKIKND